MVRYQNNDITEYIKNTNINEAREQGVVVIKIDCKFTSKETQRTIERNIREWVKNNNVLLNQDNNVETYTYGGAAYNGRKLTGRSYKEVKAFSEFYIESSNDGGYIESLEFQMKYVNHTEKYGDHENFHTKGVPNMLQIAYGLIKKYEGEKFKIEGFIPGKNEPNDVQREVYGL